MLKGFMIFLIATAWLVSWSFAELGPPSQYFGCWTAESKLYQTRPNAPIPTGCRSVYLYSVSGRVWDI